MSIHSVGISDCRLMRYAEILYPHFREIEDLEAAFDNVAYILEEQSEKICHSSHPEKMTDTVAASTMDGFEYCRFRASWNINANVE